MYVTTDHPSLFSKLDIPQFVSVSHFPFPLPAQPRFALLYDSIYLGALPGLVKVAFNLKPKTCQVSGTKRDGQGW